MAKKKNYSTYMLHLPLASVTESSNHGQHLQCSNGCESPLPPLIAHFRCIITTMLANASTHFRIPTSPGTLPFISEPFNTYSTSGFEPIPLTWLNRSDLVENQTPLISGGRHQFLGRRACPPRDTTISTVENTETHVNKYIHVRDDTCQICAAQSMESTV